MSPRSSPTVELPLPLNHPALLQGLDAWLQLGLISDIQVRRLASEHLTCECPPYPRIAAEPTATEEPTPDRSTPTSRPVGRRSSSARPPPRTPRQRRTEVPATSDWLTQILHSLTAKLSVLWLLLLSVFMVVVSSAVLVITSWKSLTPMLQYSVLGAYTVLFALVGGLLDRRPSLQLTAQMLKLTAILLIPANFWMMDAFGLFRQSGSSWFAGFAALLLSGVFVLLLWMRPMTTTSALLLLNGLGLSWLHWGWQGTDWAESATYIGLVGTVLTLVWVDQQLAVRVRERPSGRPGADSGPTLLSLASPLSLQRLALMGGMGILLFRALVIQGIPITEMGAAIGLWGWLLSWLARRGRGELFWLGLMLWGCGRLLAIEAVWPGQALGLSGLGLLLLGDQLRRRSQVLDLVLFFFIGLQCIFPLRDCVPIPIRQQVVASIALWARTPAGLPLALWGVTVFPYCWFNLGLAGWLRQRRQRHLARVTEGLTLSLGVSLTGISVLNPLMVVVNLGLSAVTLVSVIRQRRSVHPGLIHLTHCTGLAAIALAVNFLRPHLSLTIWAMLLLGVMVLEWSLSGWVLAAKHRTWARSTWWVGLALAATSYCLWLSQGRPLGILWLIVPTLLTLLGQRPTPNPWTRELSWITLFLLQALTLGWPGPRLLGLGSACLLMVFNSRILPSLGTAVITIGFGLSFVGALIETQLPLDVSLRWSSSWIALTALMLWVLRQTVSPVPGSPSPLARLYGQAAEGWAIVLIVLNLMGLSLISALILFLYQFGASNPSEAATYMGIAAGLSTLAIGYRTGHRPTELGFYGLAWGAELAAVNGVLYLQGTQAQLAIANLILCGLCILVAEVSVQRAPPNYRTSWHLIPLFYAGLGWFWGHFGFTAVTGLYTLAASVMTLVIARRQPQLQPLSYLALVGVSLAANELLLYQLWQGPEGQWGDAFMILALLSLGLAVGFRQSARWLQPLLRLQPRTLPILADLHWGLANSLLLWAIINGVVSRPGAFVGVGVTLGLALYALFKGRQAPIWAELGYWEGMGAIAYFLDLTLPAPLLQQWGLAMACGLAVALYILPWQRWGWSFPPIQRLAVALPLVTIVLSEFRVGLTALLLGGAYYAWLAQQEQRPRLSYVAVVLADWAVWQRLGNLQGNVAATMLLGCSLLYIAQLDPALQAPSARNQRHLLRSLATGLMAVVALYESDGQFGWGFAAIGLYGSLTGLGLVLRVRAYAYMGTLAFVLKVLRQLWLFIEDQPELLWASGIAFGLLLFVVTATFEARRSQVVTLLESWMNELRGWE